MANGNPVILGRRDSSTRQTMIDATTPTSQQGLWVQKFGGAGLTVGSFSGTGLVAASFGGTGEFVEISSRLGLVARRDDSSDRPSISAAVSGTVQGGFGVLGTNVRGRFPEAGMTGSATQAIGDNGGSIAGIGVRGLARGGPSGTGKGVLGVGCAGHGVVGIATRSITAPAPNTLPTPLFAGLFFGNIEVDGDFTVTGRNAAAVRRPDGSCRRLHCVESPEASFEDPGNGDIVGGLAAVTLDPVFAALVYRDDFHVFLTPKPIAVASMSRGEQN